MAKETRPKLHRLLDAAIQATREECACACGCPDRPEKGRYEQEIGQYLDSLFQSDTKGAMVLSQLYPLIFGQKRRGKRVLVACVGSVLHEIGARMVAVKAIKSAAAEHRPDLVALSVTMPQHLPHCREAVKQLRK